MPINNIRPDIKILSSGEISIMSYIYQALEINPGDAIGFKEINGELHIYISHKNAKSNIKGRTYRSCKSGNHLRIQWVEQAKSIIKKDGHSDRAYYRAGEPIEINGIKYLPIITRRNYAAENQL